MEAPTNSLLLPLQAQVQPPLPFRTRGLWPQRLMASAYRGELFITALAHPLVVLYRLVSTDSIDALWYKVFSTAASHAARLSCPEVTHDLLQTMAIPAAAC